MSASLFDEVVTRVSSSVTEALLSEPFSKSEFKAQATKEPIKQMSATYPTYFSLISLRIFKESGFFTSTALIMRKEVLSKSLDAAILLNLSDTEISLLESARLTPEISNSLSPKSISKSPGL